MSEPEIRVLLIEDNPGDVGLIHAYLHEAQEVRINLEHADRLSADLERLARADIDMVLLDLGLPDSFGPPTLNEVLRRYPSVPVVVLTSADLMEQTLEGVRAGASDYLFKGHVDGPLLTRTLRFAVERAVRRRVTSRLAEAEARYRTLFEQSPDGIVLMDPETHLPVEFNDAACDQLDYSRDEFSRLRLEDYEMGDSPEQVRGRMADVLRTGQCGYETQHRTRLGEIRYVMVAAQTLELSGRRLLPIEHRIVRRDGTMRWVRNTMIPHRGNGAVERYDGLIEDITERKTAERALHDQEIQLLAAQKIQEKLLPHAPPALPGFDIAALLHPAEFAAGDYYDYLSMRDGRTGIAVGDVSGHGFAPALIMACTHVILRLLRQGEKITFTNWYW